MERWNLQSAQTEVCATLLGNEQVNGDDINRRPDQIKFSGRILFLTEDTSLIRQQLEAGPEAAAQLEAELAQRLQNDDLPLMSNISTDEITPGWVCFYYDETLGQYVYVGMREGAVQKDEVKHWQLRSRSLRSFKRLRFLTRNGALRRESRRRSTSHRQKYRKNLRSELPEHRSANLNRLWLDRTNSTR